MKWNDENRYFIGKYASEHGNTAAVRNFQKQFPNIKESTVEEFKKRYEKQLQEAKKGNLQPPTSIERYRSKTGQPLLLEKSDSMVEKYIEEMCNQGAFITWSIANATAKALIRKYLNVVGEMDLDSSYWVQSLFCRIGFSRRQKTSTKVNLPESARKEIEYLFLCEIVSKEEKNAIPDSQRINFDQQPLKMVQCGNNTLARKNSKAVTIVGADDKRFITATFSFTLSGIFLPIQLIY